MLAAFGSDYRHSTPHVKAVNRVSVRGILSHGGLRKDNPDIKVITGFYRSPGIADVYNTHHAHPYRWTYVGQPLVRATPFSTPGANNGRDGRGLAPAPNVLNVLLSPSTL